MPIYGRVSWTARSFVVREGVTPIRALKKSFESLDNPKLVGMVLNEASEFDRTSYADQYYALGGP